MPSDPNPSTASGTQSLRQLQAVFDTAVDAIITISSQGIILSYNAASEHMFGWLAEQAIGKNITLLMPKADARAHDGYLAQHLKTGKKNVIGIGRYVTGCHQDRRPIPLHLSVGSYDVDGEKFFTGIIRDLTQEEAEQERLRLLQDQLNVLGQHAAVSEMGAALAHELNQPLTAIDLFLVAAEKSLTSDPDTAKQHFKRVREEVARAGAIIRRIRQMVEHSPKEHAAFDLRDTVDSAVELCRVVNKGPHSASILIDVPALCVWGDVIQIRQILVNLIKNALDATEGQVDQQIIVSARSNDMVEIDVSDTGPGVSAAFIDKLFEPFATTKPQGLGIGLSICRSIAQSHGGKLTYLPREHQTGSVFRLLLPPMPSLPKDIP